MGRELIKNRNTSKKLFQKIFFATTMMALFVPPAIPSEPTVYDRRMEKLSRWVDDGIFVLPYKPTYILPLSYNTNPNPVLLPSGDTQKMDYLEAKFQLSLKIRLIPDIMQGRGHFFFGYTQLSMWQVYNKELSSPFRDTNYEPEFFLDFDTNNQLGRFFHNRVIGIGAVHQSNGREEHLSRSWNRIYAHFLFDWANSYIDIKPWYRLPESTETDDNPDIDKYYGYGELRWAYMHRHVVYSAMLRNNLRSKGNKGAIEANMSFPMTKVLYGYIQYFNGYGECLMDYNHPNNRLSIGISLTDWL